MNPHVTQSFLQWHERTLSEEARSSVDRHLHECAQCRSYYDKMTLVFDDPVLLSCPEMTIDSSIVQRIQSLSVNANARPHRHLALKWSMATAGFALAVLAGVFIGKGLSATDQSVQGSTDLSKYHNSIAQHGVLDDWEELTQ
jgi:predicted anti-sigma-YlaC factor YlaD